MDNYHKLREIGQGNYGKVYQIQHIQTKQQYIMKTIDIRTLTLKQRSSAFNEIFILKQLNHPFIIYYKESFLQQNQFMSIVMEYAKGGDMLKKLEQQKKLEKRFSEH